MRKKFQKAYVWLGIADDAAEPLAWFTAIGIVIFIGFRIAFGMNDANDPKLCRVESIGDILLSPAYAVGCNISKKRFDLHLN